MFSRVICCCTIRFALLALGAWCALGGPSGAQSPPSPAVQSASFERTASDGQTGVRFARREPQVGDQLEQNLGVKLQLNTMVRQANEVIEQGATALRRRQRRVMTTTHVEGGMAVAVMVRYAESGKQLAAAADASKLGEPSLTPQCVEGKTYRCSRDGEVLRITDADGKIPPLDEYEIVAQNMETLGRPNPLAVFLADQTVAIGQRLALPNEVAAKLLGLGGEMGEVTRFDLTLREIKSIDGATCAVFEANVEAASSDSSQMRLAVAGPLAIQVDTCRAVEANFTGPIGMSETRGSLSATYQLIGTGNMTVEIASKYDDVQR